MPVLSAVEFLREVQGLDGGRPLEIEIGCGNGHFLAEYAARSPQVCVAGLEIKNSRCQKAQHKIERGSLSNARVVLARAEQILPGLPPGRVRAYHLYFPDPWPKSRHRRRRFFRGENLRVMTNTLAPGGRILFGTDFFDYYLQAKVLIALEPALALEAPRPPEEVFRSVFAQRFRDISKHIRFLTACKTCQP